MSYLLAARDDDSLDLPERVPAGGAPDDPFGTLIGESASLKEAVEIARKAASRGGANILLNGETGSGKDVFARGLHYAGPRPDSPFVAINCAAIPLTLLESELFGFERGAFTGARQTKQGLLELAADGTLFLDEVSSLPWDLQPKLLRALEERRVRRVGGIDEITIRCRVIAATNEPLEELVRAGTFREDLYYRLNVVRITIPALRDRPGDVEILAEWFLRELAAAQGLPATELTRSALALLEQHRWPGNVRELKNVMERALVMSDGGPVKPEHLLLDQRELRGAGLLADGGGRIDIPAGGRSLASVEAELVRITLGLNGWNKAATARTLGISRPTLDRKIGLYGIEPPEEAS